MSATMDHDYGQLAEPVHIQQLEHALRIEPLLSYVENIVKEPIGFRYWVISNRERKKERERVYYMTWCSSFDSDGCDSSEDEFNFLQPCLRDEDDNKILNGITITKAGISLIHRMMRGNYQYVIGKNSL